MVVVTSCRWGTLRMMTGLSANSVPARIGSTAFLDPETRTCPESGTPPLIMSLFIRYP